MRKAVQTLSSAKASFCRREAGEREKESARGTMGRGKIYERLRSFLFSRRPGRASYFSITAIFIGILLSPPQRLPLVAGESK